MNDQQMKIFKCKVLYLIDDIMHSAPNTTLQHMYSQGSLVSVESQSNHASVEQDMQNNPSMANACYKAFEQDMRMNIKTTVFFDNKIKLIESKIKLL